MKFNILYKIYICELISFNLGPLTRQAVERMMVSGGEDVFIYYVTPTATPTPASLTDVADTSFDRYL